MGNSSGASFKVKISKIKNLILRWSANPWGSFRNIVRQSKWEDFEYFDTAWKKRIFVMSMLIKDNETSILDLGCGKMWLKEYIPNKTQYYGCDRIKRDANTIVCDFNKKEFPVVKVDVCFCSGCLEYVDDVDWFFDKISNSSTSFILSYCTTDVYPSIRKRKSMGWVNHLSSSKLKKKIQSHGLVLSMISNEIPGNLIMRFDLES